jgi:hypothetical protein
MLPFDLHVLSLPLAFILSQDQTLHCIKCIILFPDLLSLFSNYSENQRDIRFHVLLQYLKERRFFKLFSAKLNSVS